MEQKTLKNNWPNQDWEYYRIQELRGKKFRNEWPSIPEYLQYSIERYPENIAFTTFAHKDGQRESITYKELATYIETLAKSLKHLGLNYGDRVAISGTNSPTWGIVFLAVQCLGLVAVPLDNRKDAPFHKHIIEFSQAKLLCMDSVLLEKLEATGFTAEHTFCLERDPNERDPNQRKNTYKSIWSLIEKTDNASDSSGLSDLTTLADIDSEHTTATLLTTSGTTGNEKLATLSHANLTSNVLQCLYPGLQEILSEDRMYLLLPLHHCYPLTSTFLEGIFHGSELVFPRGLAVQQILQDMKDGRITVFMGIPMLFNKILQGVLDKVAEQNPLKRSIFYSMLGISKLADRIGNTAGIEGNPIGRILFANILKAMGFENIRILICGAGALMPNVGQKYRQLGLNFLQGYGLTEAAPIVTLNPVGTPSVSSVGKLLPLIDGYLLEQTEANHSTKDKSGKKYKIGELCIKGPNIMQGYYQKSEATQQVFTPEGYLRTGDVGYFDTNGYFYITGRCKNIIVTEGGKNIYPEELEELFQSSKTMEQVMVRGYRVEGKEAVEIVIYPKLSEQQKQDVAAQGAQGHQNTDKEKLYKILKAEEMQALLAELRQLCRSLEAFQKPSRVRIVLVPLELTTTQKIRRFLVEKRLQDDNYGLLIATHEF